MKTLIISYKFLFITLMSLPLALCSSDNENETDPEQQNDLFTDVAVAKKISEINGLDISDPRWNSRDVDEVTSFMFSIGNEVRDNRLTYLSFKGRGIQTLPSDIRRLDALKRFSLAECQISNLPKEIGEMKSLEQLFIENNLLSQLPTELGNLEKLAVLRMNDNQFTSIPIDILKNLKLESLSMTNNDISEIPSAISEIPITHRIIHSRRKP